MAIVASRRANTVISFTGTFMRRRHCVHRFVLLLSESRIYPNIFEPFSDLMLEWRLWDVSVHSNRYTRSILSFIHVPVITRRYLACSYHCCLSTHIFSRFGKINRSITHRNHLHWIRNCWKFDELPSGTLQDRSMSFPFLNWITKQPFSYLSLLGWSAVIVGWCHIISVCHAYLLLLEEIEEATHCTS